jgi:hypothetical protein
VTCGYISSNDNFRSVQHLHEEAACDKESDVAVPGGDHLSGNSACRQLYPGSMGSIPNNFGCCLAG